MIIWRGFGFVAVILGALGFLAGTGLSSLVSTDGELNGAMIGLGVLLGGVATFALGWYLNVINPAKKSQTWVEQRRAELSHAVASGRFQPAPGVVPSSLAEAQVQADMMLDQESTAVTRRLRNIHTLFWIPMQWWGVVYALIGVVVAILLLAG
ncbi:transcriptional accessory protein [Pseudactinotalea suaedae]|uniref:transcriptional accessory protein n=1 Tax=Pseudactinotalea suaedae TaxID=1524924 RepID=UPI0012E16C0D|nr:transcriptional accessory protein [Pseudactinotalea suaedae]